MLERLIFFITFSLSLFAAYKTKTSHDRKYFILFIISVIAIFGSLAFLLSGLSQPGLYAARTDFFVNGRFIGSDRGGLPVVPVLTVISGVLSTIVVWALAGAVQWVLAGDRKRKYTAWSCCNLSAFFMGIIPLLYTRRAFSGLGGSPDGRALKKAKIWNCILSPLMFFNIFRLFVLA